jgi:hypothetical protein
MQTFYKTLSVFLYTETYMMNSAEDGRINTDLNSKNILVQLILIQCIIIICLFLLSLDVFVSLSTYAYFVINYWAVESARE